MRSSESVADDIAVFEPENRAFARQGRFRHDAEVVVEEEAVEPVWFAYDQEERGKKIEGGMEVRVEGRTDAAVKVARNHASIISDFVETGELYKEHARALPRSVHSE